MILNSINYIFAMHKKVSHIITVLKQQQTKYVYYSYEIQRDHKLDIADMNTH